MAIEIRPIQANDVIFTEKQLTYSSLYEILKTIYEMFGDVTITYFFDRLGNNESYKDEKYFSGAQYIKQDTNELVFCEAPSFGEAIPVVSELINTIGNIDYTDTTNPVNSLPVRIGAQWMGDVSGKVVEIFIIDSECFILTSTRGVNWNTIEEANQFGSNLFNWFISYYCEGMSYDQIFRVVF